MQPCVMGVIEGLNDAQARECGARKQFCRVPDGSTIGNRIIIAVNGLNNSVQLNATTSDTNTPFGTDTSATQQVQAGYQATCKK